MTFRQLSMCIAIMRAGSITKAAEALYISPQALTQQLKKFERELGFELFARSPAGSMPTEAGRRFLEGANYLIDYSNHLVEECRSIAGRGKRLRVGQIPLALHSADIARSCARLLDLQRPEMVLLKGADESAPDAVANGLVDAVEWVDEPLVRQKGLVFERVCNISHLCAVSVTNKLASRTVVTPEDLVGYHVFILRRQWYAQLLGAIGDADTRLDVEERPDMGYQDVVLLCSEDDNVVVTFGPNLHRIAGLAYVPLEGIDPLDVGVIHRPEPNEAVDGYVRVYRQLFE